MAEPEQQPWTSQDEDNLLLEISQDRRLQRLGIDPDADPLSILLELKQIEKAMSTERAERNRAQG